jgi:hypothetical protein
MYVCKHAVATLYVSPPPTVPVCVLPKVSRLTSSMLRQPATPCCICSRPPVPVCVLLDLGQGLLRVVSHNAVQVGLWQTRQHTHRRTGQACAAQKNVNCAMHCLLRAPSPASQTVHASGTHTSLTSDVLLTIPHSIWLIHPACSTHPIQTCEYCI